MSTRCVKLVHTAERIQRLPLGRDAKDIICGMCVVSIITYGSEQGFPPLSDIRTCRTAISRAIRGDNPRLRSFEIFFTAVLKGHRSDPLQALAYDAFLTLRRIPQKNDEVHELFAEVWNLRRQNGSRPSTGPVRTLMTLVGQWGWLWDFPFHIHRPDKGQSLLLDQPKNWFLHQIRDALRRQRWPEVVHPSHGFPRKDMKGFEVIDLVATSALLRDKVGRDWRLTPYQKGLLVSILTGRFRPCSRLPKAGLRDSDRCPHCALDVSENKKHVFWGVPGIERNTEHVFSAIA